MTKTKSFLLKMAGFLIFSLIFIPFCSQALIAPQVYFTDSSLNKNDFSPGELVRGSVSLWNYENFAVSDLVLQYHLYQTKTADSPARLLDRQVSQDVFSLAAGEKTTKAFVYNLPESLPSADSFTLQIQLANTKGEQLGWEDKEITIANGGVFLSLENHWIVLEQELLSPGGGVYYRLGESPEIMFDIKNESSRTVTVFPEIITYKRNIGGAVVQEEKKESVTIVPGETKTQKYMLVNIVDPDTYVTEVKLYDVQSQNLASNPIAFRWIAASTEDAEILFVQADKYIYDEGDQAKIKIQYTGPAFGALEGGKQTIEVELINAAGEIVGSAKKTVEATVGETEIEVAVKRSVENPLIGARIIKEGKVVDEYTVRAESAKEVDQKPVIRLSFWEKYRNIILPSALAIIILALIAMAYIYLRKKKQGIISFWLICFLLGTGIMFFAGDALAATTVAKSACDTTVVFNKPAPNQTYQPGDEINFSGSFQVTSCGDGLFFNKLTFYITQDINIPITTADYCRNFGGASSSYYTDYTSPTGYYHNFDYRDCLTEEGWNSMPDLCTIQGCNQVQVLNPAPGTAYKFGTIYPPDLTKWDAPYKVRFDETFTIPEDLEFSGPVRFYIEYSGTHWKNHWHWHIAYQNGNLAPANNPPTAINLRVTQPDYRVSGPGAIFNWLFVDPDEGDEQSAYRINVDNDSNFSSPVVQSGKVQSSSDSYAAPSGRLQYNSTYYWRLMVYDLKNLASTWILGPSFSTPKHQYPTADFEWAPPYPSVDEAVQFTDKSQAYGGSSIKSWSWNIPGATYISGTSASSQNPQVEFNSTESRNITLTVTDTDDYTNSVTKNIRPRLPLPQVKETEPEL